MGSTARQLAFESPATFLTPKPVTQPVKVWNQRGTELSSPADITETLLDGPGFALIHSPTAVQNFEDNAEVRSAYYPEVMALVRRLLPAATFDPLYGHIFRNEQILEHDFSDPAGALGPPAVAVHNDMADDMSEDRTAVLRKYPEVTVAMGRRVIKCRPPSARAQSHLYPYILVLVSLSTFRWRLMTLRPHGKVTGMRLREGKRLVVFNLWRSVSARPLARMPLMVLDRTSVDAADLRYMLNPNATPPFNMHSVRPREGQRWCVFSEQTRDEALVFLGYDSHPAGGAIFRPTLHSAVDIPGSGGLHQRESIEVRLFCWLPLDGDTDGAAKL
jgi:hypothetical protein